jgi:hypothetical protein
MPIAKPINVRLESICQKIGFGSGPALLANVVQIKPITRPEKVAIAILFDVILFSIFYNIFLV